MLYDTIIIGGGLAGLTAAIHLTQQQHHVLVFEKQEYPHHKVCGEYISNEITPYLKKLGICLSTAVDIDTLQFSTVKGNSITTKLPLGGKGISRYALDNLFYTKAVELKITFIFESVCAIKFSHNVFHIETDSGSNFTSRTAIGAYGKRSVLDKQLKRSFIEKKSSWLAVKAHYQFPDFPEHLVALHNFKGGYGGLSKTESGAINFCYLVHYKSFKTQKDRDNFNSKIIAKNPFLEKFLQQAIPIFDPPLSIAQISFEPKKAVENHVLMCGDAAGLIHPLCGNGMAMAIHSAKIACELLTPYLSAPEPHRNSLEKAYQKQWNIVFKRRLWIGRKLQWLLLHDKLSNISMRIIAKSPQLLTLLIQQTHGKPVI